MARPAASVTKAELSHVTLVAIGIGMVDETTAIETVAVATVIATEAAKKIVTEGAIAMEVATATMEIETAMAVVTGTAMELVTGVVTRTVTVVATEIAPKVAITIMVATGEEEVAMWAATGAATGTRPKDGTGTATECVR